MRSQHSGAETWGMRSAEERRKVNVLEMKCLRSLVGVSPMDRVRNEEVRRRAGIERKFASRADQRVLRLFGHVERMDDYRMARRVLGRVRGRQRLGWMDGVKVALGNRGMTVEAARQCAKDRKEWRALVHMYLNEFHAANFAWHCVLSDRPPVIWWLSHGEGRGTVI